MKKLLQCLKQAGDCLSQQRAWSGLAAGGTVYACCKYPGSVSSCQCLQVWRCHPFTWPPPEPVELVLLQASCPCPGKSEDAKGLSFTRHHVFTESGHCSSDLIVSLPESGFHDHHNLQTILRTRSLKRRKEGKKGSGRLCWFTALIMGSQGLLERRNW